MVTFDLLWISTDEHLRKFKTIIEQASDLEKMFGLYKLPPDFPHVHMFWGILPMYRFPGVPLASGIGRIDDTRFIFQSKSFSPFGSVTRNLLDLEFDLDTHEFSQVTHATAESPLNRYYNLPFTRVQTSRDGLLNNFLVCVGGSGPSMKKINAQSEELFRSLEKLVSKKVSRIFSQEITQ